MTDIRYYPVIDMDSEGVEKQTMPPTTDRAAVREHHRFWLEEIVPRYYRLCSGCGVSAEIAGAYIIHCSTCGKKMQAISAPLNEYRLGLYCCPDCAQKKVRI